MVGDLATLELTDLSIKLRHGLENDSISTANAVVENWLVTLATPLLTASILGKVAQRTTTIHYFTRAISCMPIKLNYGRWDNANRRQIILFFSGKRVKKRLIAGAWRKWRGGCRRYRESEPSRKARKVLYFSNYMQLTRVDLQGTPERMPVWTRKQKQDCKREHIGLA